MVLGDLYRPPVAGGRNLETFSPGPVMCFEHSLLTLLMLGRFVVADDVTDVRRVANDANTFTTRAYASKMFHAASSSAIGRTVCG